MTPVDKIPPAGLHPQLVKALLDNLETNKAFRATFQASPEQALRSLGYTDPWACMQFSAGATLASPEQIRAQRSKWRTPWSTFSIRTPHWSHRKGTEYAAAIPNQTRWRSIGVFIFVVPRMQLALPRGARLLPQCLACNSDIDEAQHVRCRAFGEHAATMRRKPAALRLRGIGFA